MWPSKIGSPKSPLFFLQPSYWYTPKRQTPQAIAPSDLETVFPVNQINEEDNKNRNIPHEHVDTSITGPPTVSIRGLKKTFEKQVAVNEITFDMYPNQVCLSDYSCLLTPLPNFTDFCSLGAQWRRYLPPSRTLLVSLCLGKTTTINMLTGLLPPDYFSSGDASIYGHSVLHEMDEIRYSMGVCPQVTPSHLFLPHF